MRKIACQKLKNKMNIRDKKQICCHSLHRLWAYNSLKISPLQEVLNVTAN